VIDLLPPVAAATPARPGPTGGGRAGAGDDAPADFASLLAALAGAMGGAAPGPAQDAATGLDREATAEDDEATVSAGAVGDPTDETATGELTPGDLDAVPAATGPAIDAPVDEADQTPAPGRAEPSARPGGRPADAGATHRAEQAPDPAGPNPGTDADARPTDAGRPSAGPAEPASPVAHGRTTASGSPQGQAGSEPGEAGRAAAHQNRPAPTDARPQAEPAPPGPPPAPATGGAAAVAATPATPTATAAAAPAAPAPEVPVEQSVAEQVVTRVSSLRLEAGRSELSIDLHPVDLGRLRVELTLEDGALRVALRAESGATGDLLRRAVPELRAALEEAGLGVADLHVGPDHRPDARHPGTSEGSTADTSPTGSTGSTSVTATAPEPGADDPTDLSGRHGLDLLL
jgi:flagellar hook-length control protein FliK